MKNWIINIDKTDELPSDIVALNFDLYEPYSIELLALPGLMKKTKIRHAMKILNQPKEPVPVLKFQTTWNGKRH